MMRFCTRAVLITLLLLGASQVSAQNTPTFSPIATISATTTLQPNRICYSDGRDIVCDTSAPTLGNVGVTDRITSGTLAITANSSTQVVSLSTSGVDWGYFKNSGLSYLPGLGTGQIGVGITNPSASVHILGTLMSDKFNSGGAIVLRGATGSQSTPTALTAGTFAGLIVFRGYDGADYKDLGIISMKPEITMTSSSVLGSMYFSTTGAAGGGAIQRMIINSDGNVGINTLTPSATLAVNGLVSTTAIQLATSTGASIPPAAQCAGRNDYGKVMYGGDNRPYICNPRP